MRDTAQPEMSEARSAGESRRRRWKRHSAEAGHQGGGQASGGERSEPPGKERAVREADGGARDARPKGQDRVAGLAGQPGREATPTKTKPESAIQE